MCYRKIPHYVVSSSFKNDAYMHIVERDSDVQQCNQGRRVHLMLAVIVTVEV